MSAVLVALLLGLAAWWWVWPEPRPRRPGSAVPRRGWGRRMPSDSAGRSGREPPVAEAMDLLALALAGGATVPAALTTVGEVTAGERGRQLHRVAAALAWGVDEAEAWEHAAPEWTATRHALSLAERAGVAPAGLLTEAAQDQRRAALARAEQAAGRLPVHLVLPLGLLFLPAFMLTTVAPVVLALAHGLLSGL